MDPKTMHHAMRSVMEDMGRAAREGKARRFTKKPLEVTMGEVTLSPHHDAAAEREEETGESVDPVKQAHAIGDTTMSQQEMDELSVQR